MNTISMYWWKDCPNFGDAISPKIVAMLSGLKPVHSEKPGGRLFALGSINTKAGSGDTLWGCGGGYRANREKTIKWDPSKIEVLAMRGPLSRQVVLDCGGKAPELYGDPGLLLPQLYPTCPKPIREVTLVPHLDDHAMWEFGRNRGLPLVNVRSNWKQIVDELCASEHVVTSSLHVLIACEAYGIPVTWATGYKAGHPAFSGSMTKFDDYFLGCGRETRELLRDLDQAVSRRPDPYVQKISQPFVEALLEWLTRTVGKIGDLPANAAAMSHPVE